MYLSRRGFYLPKSYKDITKIQKKLTVTPIVNPEFDLSVLIACSYFVQVVERLLRTCDRLQLWLQPS